MAKINIKFNNTEYSIEESLLSSAINSLKGYLSTTMSGTGAQINFNGVDYSIDSVKLAAARNVFTTSLGKIAGTGKKVVINGVEYGIDAEKANNIIIDFEEALDNIINSALPAGLYRTGAISLYEEQGPEAIKDMLITSWDDLVADGKIFIDGPVVRPGRECSPMVKNEYGFYFNQLYAFAGGQAGMIFFEDGSANMCDHLGTVLGQFPAGSVTYEQGAVDLSAINTNFGICNFSEDGRVLTVSGAPFILQGIDSIVKNEYGFYFNQLYAILEWNAGFIFYEDGSIDECDSSGNVKTSYPAGTVIYSEGYADISAVNGFIARFEEHGMQMWLDTFSFILMNAPQAQLQGDLVIPKIDSDYPIYIDFSQNKSLTGIMVPESINSLEGSFMDCSNLRYAIIPSAMFGSKRLFYNCISLTSIKIAEGYSALGQEVFAGCSNLVNVYVPKSVTFINPNAFHYCTSLQNVYYAGTEEQWNDISIIQTGNSLLLNATIHYNYQE